jgi:hypothetical protein
MPNLQQKFCKPGSSAVPVACPPWFMIAVEASRLRVRQVLPVMKEAR